MNVSSSCAAGEYVRTERQEVWISKNIYRQSNGQCLGYVGVEFQRNLSILNFHAACAQVGVAGWWRQNFEKLTPPRRRPMSKVYWCKFSARSEHLYFSRSKWVNGRGSVMTSFSRKINTAIVSGVLENIPVPNFSAIGALWIFDLPSGGPPAERSQHCAMGVAHVTWPCAIHSTHNPRTIANNRTIALWIDDVVADVIGDVIKSVPPCVSRNT